MLLVLGSLEDQTTKCFVHYARTQGVVCEVANNWREPILTVQADRRGSMTVSISAGNPQTRVSAVMNRGTGTPRSGNADVDFLEAETLAAWWTALAAFPGPVINRPGKLGWMPAIEPTSLLRPPITSFTLGGAIAATGIPKIRWTLPVNVHRLRDGYYMGRLADCEGTIDPTELHTFTPFSPDRTIHFLIAGRQVFDLSVPDGCVSQERAKQLAPLLYVLRARGASFSLLVVEPSEGKLFIRHSTAFPSIHQYSHIQSTVHQALLRYLIP